MFATNYIDRVLGGLALFGTIVWAIQSFIPNVPVLGDADPVTFTVAMWVAFVAIQIVKYVIEEED